MALTPISEVRQRDVTRGPGYIRAALERASVYCIVIPAASLNAGDIQGGSVLYDSEFLGAYWDQLGDEGTNGTAIIEKWNDSTGSDSQTTISASLTVDAGAASLEWIAPLTTGVELVATGYKLNVKTTGVDGAPAGIITCWFKLVDDLGIAG